MPQLLPTVQLYRRLLCAARKLPHAHLRDFYRLRYNGEFRRHRYTQGQTLENLIKRGHTELRMLERANGSQTVARAKRITAFDKMLDMAYGRSGPLKQEILKVVQDAPPEEPLLTHVPSTRPPSISPLFLALSTSALTRSPRHKALQSRQNLTWPLSLPVRDTPELLAAFGPVPRRRVANARKKAFNMQRENIYTPLEVLGETEKAAETMGGRTLPFQGSGLQQEASQLAGLRASNVETAEVTPTSHVPPMPTRYLRRRYQALMRRLPTTTAQVSPKGKLSFNLSISDGAIATDRDRPIPRASSATIDWWAANPITQEPKSRGKDTQANDDQI